MGQTPATPTWNGFAATSVLAYQRQPLWAMGCEALNERSLVPNLYGPVNNGDDIQSVAPQIVYRMQSINFNDTGTHDMSRPNSDGKTFSWVDLSQYGSIAGSTTAFQMVPLTRASVFGYAGLTLGWPRKRDRSIQFTTAATDAQGNAAVAGQIARGSDKYTTPGAPAGPQGVYKCIAAGNWQHQASGQPDLLDAYGGTIPLFVNGATGDLANDTGHPSADQVGDRRGPWIFSSFRDICNLMQKVQVQIPDSGTFPNNETTSFGVGSGSTWAAATAAAAASWPTATGTGFPYAPNQGVGSYTFGYLQGGTYYAYASRVQAQSQNAVPGLGGWNANIDWWVKVNSQPAGGGFVNTFDANGDGVIGVGWRKLLNSVGVSGTILSPMLGNAGGGIPNWCAAPTAGNPTFQGWVAGWATGPNLLMVCDFNVPGGFQYTSTSP